MFRRMLFSLLVLSITSFTTSVTAVPILGFDMDPSTPGIQSSLSLPEGSPLTINLVAYDDGTPVTPILVDTVATNILAAGTGTVSLDGAAAGAFGLGLLGGTDFGDGMPLFLDPTLASGPVLPGSLGFFAYFGAPSLLSISTAAAAAVADTFNVLMELDFTAISAGIVTFDALGSPPGSELLFAAAGLLSPELISGTLEITGTVPPVGVPEPTILTLFAIGLVGILRRKSIQ